MVVEVSRMETVGMTPTLPWVRAVLKMLHGEWKVHSCGGEVRLGGKGRVEIAQGTIFKAHRNKAKILWRCFTSMTAGPYHPMFMVLRDFI